MLQISRILYNYTFLAFSQVAMVAIGIFTTAMLARFLGPHEYGRYNLFIFFVQVLSIFASTWIINPAAAKFANQEFLTSKNIKKTFSSEVLIILFNIIFVGLVLFFLRSRVHNFLGGYGNTRVLLAFSYLIIFALYNLCYGSLQGAMDFKSYGIMPLMRAVIFMLFLSALMAGSFNFDFIVVFLILSYFLVFIFYWNKLKHIANFVFDKQEMLAILSFSWPMILFSTANFTLDWIDKYLLNIFVSTYAVGIYSAAWNLTTNLVLIPQLLYAVLLPVITSYKLTKKEENIRFYLRKLIPQFSLIFSIFVGFLAICATFLIPLVYGKEYILGVDIFILLSIGSVFMSIKYMYNPVSTVFNLIRFTGAINVVSALICVSLSCAFIAKYGMKGAAFATTLSSLFACVAVMMVINKRFKIFDLKPIYCSAPAIVTSVSCLLIKNSYINISLFIVVLMVTLLIIKKYKVFHRSDLEYIRKIDMPHWIRNTAESFYGIF